MGIDALIIEPLGTELGLNEASLCSLINLRCFLRNDTLNPLLLSLLGVEDVKPVEEYEKYHQEEDDSEKTDQGCFLQYYSCSALARCDTSKFR